MGKNLLLSLIAILILISFTQPAAAQSTTFLWSHGTSIPTQMTLTNAQLCDLGFANRGIWPGTICGDGTGTPTGTVSIDLGANYTITSVELGWEYCCGNSVFSLSINGDSIGALNPSGHYIYSNSFNASTVSIAFSAFMFMDYISISYETASTSSDLTRPVRLPERQMAFQSIGIRPVFGEEILANGAVMFAGTAKAMVSAVTAGTITLIEPLTINLCYSLFTPAANNLELGDVADSRDRCRVTIVGEAGMAGTFVELFPPSANPFYTTPFAAPYLIHIQGDDGREYLQIATDVPNFAYEGQRVSPGCWLGRILVIPEVKIDKLSIVIGLFDSLSLLKNLIDFVGEEKNPFEALTAVWVKADETTFVDAWNEYVSEPSDSAPCNRSDEDFAGCMGDYDLRDATQWQSPNGVTWLETGLVLPPGSFVRGVFNLNGGREPQLIVGGYSRPKAVVSVFFGTAISAGKFIDGSDTVEMAAGSPDVGDFYTVEVQNVGVNPVRIDFICVWHKRTLGGDSDQTPPATPTTAVCYFKDASFEKGLESWDGSEDVQADDGSLLLPDDSTISQNLKLKAGTYTLTVIVQVWRSASYEPDEDNTSGGITIEYGYPDDTFISMGSKTWSQFVHLTQIYKSEIVVSSETDGTFSLRAQIAAAPTGARGAQINSACLVREGSAPPPPDNGDGLIEPTCGTIATPSIQITQPGTWSTWLWAHLNKFYRCELIRVINSMYTAMINFFRTMLWTARWGMASIGRAGNFANSTLYWLNGHLYNVAVGHVYVVEGHETYDTSADLGDVILGGIKSVIDVFISLLQRIIDFIFYLLNLVFTLMLSIVVALVRIAIVLIGLIIATIGQFFDLINTLFFAWNNSTATPIAGVPQCAIEPKGNVICIFLWTLENTIFSGRGFLFIPFMIAFGSAELLLWTISKFAKKTQDTANGG